MQDKFSKTLYLSVLYENTIDNTFSHISSYQLNNMFNRLTQDFSPQEKLIFEEFIKEFYKKVLLSDKKETYLEESPFKSYLPLTENTAKKQ